MLEPRPNLEEWLPTISELLSMVKYILDDTPEGTPRESQNQNEETDPLEHNEPTRAKSPLPIVDESKRSHYYTLASPTGSNNDGDSYNIRAQ